MLERNYSDAADSPEYPLAESENQRLGAAWFGLGVAYPFLEDESCSIHKSRPLTCREYLVTSPAAACSRLYQEPVDRIEIPVRIGQALARATARIAGVSVATISLVMALEAAPRLDAALSEPRDLMAMLEIILSEIGDWRIDR